MVAAFIAKRIAFNQQRSFSRFIIRLSIVATAISVMVMILTLAFTNGFQAEVSNKVFSFLGHIRIQENQPPKAIIAEEIPLQMNDTLEAEIRKNPAVRQIHPFSTKYAILKTSSELEGVLLKGYNADYDFSYLQRFMVEGRPIQFNDSTYSREIMLSEYTAQQLGLKTGDRILIYFVQPDGRPRPNKLTISGIYKTGIEEYDRTFAVGDQQLIQRLNDWDSTEAGGYEIFLHNPDKINQLVLDIYEMPDFPIGWNTESIRDIAPNIFDWLDMQDLTRDVLIAIMIVVALINLVSCLIILVLERVRMVGILKALGARDLLIREIFLQHGLIITLAGIAFGTIAALALIGLQDATGFIRLQEEAYYLSKAAVLIRWWEVLFIAGSTFLVSMLVLFLPTIIIHRIKPVKAIRFN